MARGFALVFFFGVGFFFRGPRQFVCLATVQRRFSSFSFLVACVSEAVQVVVVRDVPCTNPLFCVRGYYSKDLTDISRSVFSPLVDRVGGSTAPTVCSTTWAKAGKGVLMGTACQTSRNSRRSFFTPRKYS